MQRSSARQPIAQPLLTKRQVGDWLNVSASTVDRLIRAEELRAIKIGNVVRLPVSAVADYIEARLSAGRP
jgi:excisionase family DNA binding protein